MGRKDAPLLPQPVPVPVCHHHPDRLTLRSTHTVRELLSLPSPAGSTSLPRMVRIRRTPSKPACWNRCSSAARACSARRGAASNREVAANQRDLRGHHAARQASDQAGLHAQGARRRQAATFEGSALRGRQSDFSSDPSPACGCATGGGGAAPGGGCPGAGLS